MMYARLSFTAAFVGSDRFLARLKPAVATRFSTAGIIRLTLKAMEASVDVLWIRHCESCSNVRNPQTEAVDKYMVPPLCTQKGIRQSLDVALRIHALATSLNIEAKNIKIYSSYLPRAMLTAALAASALRAITTEASHHSEVNVLCHVGELPNAYERAHPDPCVFGPSESTATAKSTRCWIKHFNKELQRESLAVRLNAPRKDCGQRSTPCNKGTAAWRWDGSDYVWVLHKLLPYWLADARGKRNLHVVFSHGAYIKRSLFPAASRVEGRMANTAVVFQRYFGIEPSFRFTHADPPVDYGNTSLGGISSDAAQDALATLEKWALNTWGTGCQWKETSAPWSACLDEARTLALETIASAG